MHKLWIKRAVVIVNIVNHRSDAVSGGRGGLVARDASCTKLLTWVSIPSANNDSVQQKQTRHKTELGN